MLNKRPIFGRHCRRLQFKLKRKCIICRQSGAVLLRRVPVKSTKIVKRAGSRRPFARTYAYLRIPTRNRGCTRRNDTRPEFTSLMYVLGGDRSLSRELLIVWRHNSPRASHPLSVPPSCVPPTVLARRTPTRSSPLCASVLEICACVCICPR